MPFDPNMFPIDINERANLALGNVMGGQFRAAGRALVAPNTLTPSELKRLQDKLGGGGQHHPIIQTILDVSTNPLFLMGVVLSMKYPALKATELLKWSKDLDGYKRFVHPLLMYIQSPASTFHRTGIPETMDDILGIVFQWKNKYLSRFNDAWSKSSQMAGEGGLSAESLHKVAAKLAGLDSPTGSLVKAAAKEVELLKESRIEASPMRGPLLRRIDLNPAEHAFYNSVRTDVFDEAWQELAKRTGGDKAKIARIVQAMSRRGMNTADVGTGRLPGQVGPYEADYLPQIPHFKRNAQARELSEFLGDVENSMLNSAMREVERTGAREAEHIGRIMSEIEHGVSSHRMQERVQGLGMIPHIEAIETHLKRYVNPSAMEELKGLVAARRKLWERKLDSFAGMHIDATWKRNLTTALRSMGMGPQDALLAADDYDLIVYQGNPKVQAEFTKDMLDKIEARGSLIPEYSLDMMRVVPAYINMTGPEVAWTVEGKGNHLLALAARLDPLRKSLLVNKYVPLLRGRQTWVQNLQEIAIGQYEMQAAKWLESDVAKKHVPDSVRKWLGTQVGKVYSLPAGSLSGKLASYFYVSTLGLNLSPAMKNLMQTFLTTSNMIGLKDTGRGLAYIAPRIAEYAKLRAGGMPDEEAMYKLFPEFIDAGLQPAPLSHMMAHGSISAEGPMPVARMTTGKVGQAIERTKRGMLSVFSSTERFNRLVAFYGGRARALGEGLDAASASRFGTMVTQRTQFPAGVTGMPPILVNIPGPLRQFAYFPLRFLEFLTMPRTMGGGLGTLGRTVASSVAVGAALKNLAGLDMSGGLLSGALPLPTFPGASFYPFPIVPPLLSVAGGALGALAQGDPSQLGSSLSLLAPGGVAIRRAYKVIKNADYDHPLPDGRIPLYNDKGQMVAAYTPTQLYMRAAGFNPMDFKREQAVTDYLLKQRDQMRAYRQQYMQAISKNDMGAAAAIQDEWKRRYPEMGPLVVKPASMKALADARAISRIDRVMKGMPPEARAMFQNVVGVAASNLVSQGANNPAYMKELAARLGPGRGEEGQQQGTGYGQWGQSGQSGMSGMSGMARSYQPGFAQ